MVFRCMQYQKFRNIILCLPCLTGTKGFGYNKVKKWIDKLDPSTISSNNTINSVVSDSSLQNLVCSNDSASNISVIDNTSSIAVANSAPNIEVPTVVHNLNVNLMDLPVNLIVDNIGGTDMVTYTQALSALAVFQC